MNIFRNIFSNIQGRLDDRFPPNTFEGFQKTLMVREANNYSDNHWQMILGGKDAKASFQRQFLRTVHYITEGSIEKRKDFFNENIVGINVLDDPFFRHVSHFLALSEQAWFNVMNIVTQYNEYDSSVAAQVIKDMVEGEIDQSEEQ